MENVFSIIGFLLALGAFVVVFRTWRVWQGELRDGLFLFLVGFGFLAAGFLWPVAGQAAPALITEQPIFAMGMAVLFAGSFRLFTFVYP